MFFILVIFSTTYTFLNINRGSIIWALCLFFLILFHSCNLLYHLHLPKPHQGKCNMVILPLFIIFFFIPVIFYIIYTFLNINRGRVVWALCLFALIIFFILVIFSTIYTFLHLNRRSVIAEFCLTYINHSWRCNLD